MKTLMFHSKKYEIKIVRLANKPKGINPENVNEKEQKVKDCILAFICVEQGDNLEKFSKNLSEEILKFAKEVKCSKTIICPFAHLSNNLANYKEGIKFFDLLEEELKNEIEVFRSHFGSDKSLLLEVYGHTGAVRFREF